MFIYRLRLVRRNCCPGIRMRISEGSMTWRSWLILTSLGFFTILQEDTPSMRSMCAFSNFPSQRLDTFTIIFLFGVHLRPYFWSPSSMNLFIWWIVYHLVLVFKDINLVIVEVAICYVWYPSYHCILIPKLIPIFATRYFKVQTMKKLQMHRSLIFFMLLDLLLLTLFARYLTFSLHFNGNSLKLPCICVCFPIVWLASYD